MNDSTITVELHRVIRDKEGKRVGTEPIESKRVPSSELAVFFRRNDRYSCATGAKETVFLY